MIYFYFELSGTFPIVKNNCLQHVMFYADEHISRSPLTGKKINHIAKSSVKDHCLLSGHMCSFDYFNRLEL